MTTRDIAMKRMESQKIAVGRLATPTDVVAWLGAVQAQDPIMAPWAVGARCAKPSMAAVTAAVDDGSLIRIHALRPTWHLVASADLRWIIALSAPRIRASMRGRQRVLGIDAAVLAKNRRLLEKALRDGNHLTRDEVRARYLEAGFGADDNRISHLLMGAELDGLICSGRTSRGRPTYALLDERVPDGLSLPRDEAIARLARTYFRSRAPSTPEDFAWWSGLTLGDARRAVEMIGGDFARETISEITYVVPRDGGAARRGKSDGGGVYFLPSYDEILISYADRSAVLAAVDEKRTVSENG
ncbi:MAG TPA: winged helix DNA-binding domain-containing protein, partial [Spirochaetia bacterium]